MSLDVTESGSYTNLSASGVARTGKGRLLGIFVASSSGASLKVWDNTSGATTVIVNTFPVTSSTYYPIPANFLTGCYVTITGTADITVFWMAD
jgi:hypothetical protein